MPNLNYRAGRAFEYRVMKKFFQWGYVKRHFASKGIADIVCIRNHQQGYRITGPCAEVAFIQCKYSQNGKVRYPKKDRKALIEYAAVCGARPVYAFNMKSRPVVLIDLSTDMEFTP